MVPWLATGNGYRDGVVRVDEDRGGAPAGTEVEEPCNGTVNLPQVVFIVTLVLIGSAWLGEMLIKHI